MMTRTFNVIKKNETIAKVKTELEARAIVSKAKKANPFTIFEIRTNDGRCCGIF